MGQKMGNGTSPCFFAFREVNYVMPSLNPFFFFALGDRQDNKHIVGSHGTWYNSPDQLNWLYWPQHTTGVYQLNIKRTNVRLAHTCPVM